MARKHVKGKAARKHMMLCENCGNCTYLGEGDYACMADPSDAVMVKEEWVTTEGYFHCGGKKWEEGDFT